VREDKVMMENVQSDPNDDASSPVEDVPRIEDAGDPDLSEPVEVSEDDADLLDASSRSLDAAGALADGEGEVTTRAGVVDVDDAGDADSIEAEPGEGLFAIDEKRLQDGMMPAPSAHHIAVELKSIESEVRRLLADNDPKRKRKLGGSRRWQELEEDVIAWRFTSRFQEDVLTRLRELIVRRNHLFRRLHFLAGIRPTWNS